MSFGEKDVLLLVFFVIFLVAWITCAIFADKVGRPELVTVNGTVTDVQIEFIDWRSKHGHMSSGFEFRELGRLYNSSGCGGYERYLSCEPGEGRATGPNDEPIEVKNCKPKKSCRRRGNVTSWRRPHIEMKITATHNVAEAPNPVRFSKFLPIMPEADQNISTQVSAENRISRGDTVELRYYRHQPENITGNDLREPMTAFHGFLASAIILAICWVIICAIWAVYRRSKN